MNSLSPQALKVVSAYRSLPFEGVTGVSVPYFNNKRTGNRGGFRAHKGKGSPEELVEETLIYAKQKNISLHTLSSEKIKQFMVEHKLGIDCSGFAFYILDAEARVRNTKLARLLSFTRKSFLRRLIARFRTVENTSVLDFVENSTVVPLADIAPGDFIAIIPPENSKDRDHMLVVLAVDGTKVTYAHSMQYSEDGTWDHGFKCGEFTVTHPESPLHTQQFSESGKQGSELPLVGILSRSTVTLRRILPVLRK